MPAAVAKPHPPPRGVKLLGEVTGSRGTTPEVSVAAARRNTSTPGAKPTALSSWNSTEIPAGFDVYEFLNEGCPGAPPSAVIQRMTVAKYDGDVDPDTQQFHGTGRLVSTLGYTYTGAFEQGMMTGRGKIEWPDGTSYEGDFSQNIIAGRGRYTWPNGDWYDGDLTHHVRHGRGMFYRSSSKEQYDGMWVDGKREGKGTLYYDADQLAEHQHHLSQQSSLASVGASASAAMDSPRDKDAAATTKEKAAEKKASGVKSGGLTADRRAGGGGGRGAGAVPRRGSHGRETSLPRNTAAASSAHAVKDTHKSPAATTHQSPAAAPFTSSSPKTGNTTAPAPPPLGLSGVVPTSVTAATPPPTFLFSYAGDWANDQRTGKGIMTYEDGSTYEGDWVKDVRHGTGTMRWRKNGAVVEEYTGDWVNGVPHGTGQSLYIRPAASNPVTSRHGDKPEAAVNTYVGEFANGARHGEGVFSYDDGGRYEGEWRFNVKQGMGKYTSPTGIVFVGQFVEGNPVEQSSKSNVRSDTSVSSPLPLYIRDVLTPIDGDEREAILSVQAFVSREQGRLRRVFTSYARLTDGIDVVCALPPNEEKSKTRGDLPMANFFRLLSDVKALKKHCTVAAVGRALLALRDRHESTTNNAYGACEPGGALRSAPDTVAASSPTVGSKHASFLPIWETYHAELHHLRGEFNFRDFIEAIIRVAALLYKDTAYGPLSQKLQLFVDEHLAPFASEPNAATPLFPLTRKHREAVDPLLPTLHNMFLNYASATSLGLRNTPISPFCAGAAKAPGHPHPNKPPKEKRQQSFAHLNIDPPSTAAPAGSTAAGVHPSNEPTSTTTATATAGKTDGVVATQSLSGVLSPTVGTVGSLSQQTSMQVSPQHRSGASVMSITPTAAGGVAPTAGVHAHVITTGSGVNDTDSPRQTELRLPRHHRSFTSTAGSTAGSVSAPSTLIEDTTITVRKTALLLKECGVFGALPEGKTAPKSTRIGAASAASISASGSQEVPPVNSARKTIAPPHNAPSAPAPSGKKSKQDAAAAAAAAAATAASTKIPEQRRSSVLMSTPPSAALFTATKPRVTTAFLAKATPYDPHPTLTDAIYMKQFMTTAAHAAVHSGAGSAGGVGVGGFGSPVSQSMLGRPTTSGSTGTALSQGGTIGPGSPMALKELLAGASQGQFEPAATHGSTTSGRRSLTGVASPGPPPGTTHTETGGSVTPRFVEGGESLVAKQKQLAVAGCGEKGRNALETLAMEKELVFAEFVELVVAACVRLTAPTTPASVVRKARVAVEEVTSAQLAECLERTVTKRARELHLFAGERQQEEV